MKKSAWTLFIIMSLLLLPLWVMAQQETNKATEKGTTMGPSTEPSVNEQQGAASQNAQNQQMSEKCKEMMAKRNQMNADIKAMDDRLNEKVAQMNAATGDAKVTAMASVINEMATQRKEMRDKLTSMQQDQMMCGMMGENGMGMMGMKGMDMKNCPAGMAGCGMMKNKQGNAGS